MNLITLKNISKTYGSKGTITALEKFNCTIRQGEFVAIMGKSGSGKSTVLNIISGIDAMQSGEYQFDGQDMSKIRGDQMTGFRRDNIGFVLQHFALIPDYTVYDNIALSLRLKRENEKNIREKVTAIVEELDITSTMNKYPNELSGGEAQRVAIARAIIHKPKLILADEPTGALDEESGKKIMGIFKQLHSNGNTIIMVTHDREIAKMCERIIYIKDGKNLDNYKEKN